jgi:hypothetical protein
MSTITVPSTIGGWPRLAVAVVAGLLVALALTVSLAVTLSGHTTTRNLVRLVPGQSASNPMEFCNIGRPC